LLRWSLRLSEFRLEISHISGKAHSMADCLSRYPVGEAVPEDEVPLDFNMLQMDGLDEDPFQFPEMAQINMKEEQKKDRWIKEIIDVLEDKVPRPTTKQVKLAKNFILKNEILYRKMYVEGFWRELLVIPKEMRLDVLFTNHAIHYSGHLGFRKTLSRIKTRYFFKDMIHYVEKYVRSCPECQAKIQHPREEKACFTLSILQILLCQV